MDVVVGLPRNKRGNDVIWVFGEVRLLKKRLTPVRASHTLAGSNSRNAMGIIHFMNT